MKYSYLDIKSRSSSVTEKNEFSASSHFRWQSIKNFLYVAHAISLNTSSFDLFSKLLVAHIHLFEYTICAVMIGASYMFMDFFIKQYTRKLDTRSSLNPLLRGVSFGILMQTGLSAVVHASDLADSMRYLFNGMNRAPSWSQCHNISSNGCLSSQDIIMKCKDEVIVDLTKTSAHLNYEKMFKSFDRKSLSMRFFLIAIVWICNFFIASITDNALLKLFKLSFLWGIFSTTFILTFLMFSTRYTTQAFYEIMSLKNATEIQVNMNLVSDPFGVGLIGVYDFGTMSPFTMVDNAVLIFALVFITTAFARSLIVRILYLKLTNCVQVDIAKTPHYQLFSILPLSTEFMDAHKIFVLYIYLYMMFALVACLAMFTSTMSRLLHSEFCSVKTVYIMGLLCFSGFTFSMPLVLCTTERMLDLLLGLNTCTLYLGGFKVAIVMWVYGVEKFSTDIQFWLGFEPTKFWKYLWGMLPLLIFMFVLQKFVELVNLSPPPDNFIAFAWILFTLLIVFIFMGKAVAKCIVKNNLGGVLKSSNKYGPPELEDRKRRRCFDKVVQNRQCHHNCLILDEIFDCNHLPLMYRTKSTKNTDSSPSQQSSLTNIYDAGPADAKQRQSSVINVNHLDFR